MKNKRTLDGYLNKPYKEITEMDNVRWCVELRTAKCRTNTLGTRFQYHEQEIIVLDQ